MFDSFGLAALLLPADFFFFLLKVDVDALALELKAPISESEMLVAAVPLGGEIEPGLLVAEFPAAKHRDDSLSDVVEAEDVEDVSSASSSSSSSVVVGCCKRSVLARGTGVVISSMRLSLCCWKLRLLFGRISHASVFGPLSLVSLLLLLQLLLLLLLFWLAAMLLRSIPPAGEGEQGEGVVAAIEDGVAVGAKETEFEDAPGDGRMFR